jgi:hypothetical protein
MTQKRLYDLGAATAPTPYDQVYVLRGPPASYQDLRARACDLKPGLGLNALSLSADPASVTDWGALLNAAVAAGARHLVFPDASADGSGTDYPFTTALNFNGIGQLTLRGENGVVWPGDGRQGQEPRSRLVWKGTGAGVAVDIRSTSGFTLQDLGIYYDNGAYTGRLVGGGAGVQGPASMVMIRRCHLGSRQLAYRSAEALVSFDNTIVSSVEDCTLAGAKYGVKGLETSFMNVCRVRGCTFANQSAAHVVNAGIAWEIDANTFEMSSTLGGTPTVLTSDMPMGSQFSFTNNWVGDYAAAGVPFVCPADCTWYATFRGNFVQCQGLGWSLLGGGVVTIADNPGISCGAGGQGPVIDLGNVAAGAAAKSGLFVAGNAWVCTAADAILNRAGHRNLNVFGNGAGAGTPEARTLGGHERLGYPDRYAPPSVAVGAAAGSGASAALSDGSTDLAGQVVVSVGSGPSAGVVAKVTFGTPLLSDRGGTHAPVVVLTPATYAAGALASAYIDPGLADNTGFWVSTANALAGNASWHYRVIGR